MKIKWLCNLQCLSNYKYIQLVYGFICSYLLSSILYMENSCQRNSFLLLSYKTKRENNMQSIKQKSLTNKRHRYRDSVFHLEHYDIKAPLAASLHQAVKIFELKKARVHRALWQIIDQQWLNELWGESRLLHLIVALPNAKVEGHTLSTHSIRWCNDVFWKLQMKLDQTFKDC